jgi:hypothetical protein
LQIATANQPFSYPLFRIVVLPAPLPGIWLAVKQPNAAAKNPMTDEQLLEELQRRAVHYFWEKADPSTGLVNDRAHNFDGDEYTAASTAATGYGLAALPIGVEHGWLDRIQAAARARATLRFLLTMPHQHGWMLHFLDKRNAQRLWKSEFSSIDTALLMAGAIVCGQYFARDTQTADIAVLTDTLYRRIDWWWMRTNNGARPDKNVLSHGWRPETGFISYDYGAYSEAILLYLLGLGAPANPLPITSWEAIQRPLQTYAGTESLQGGPIFIHQMPSGFFYFRNQRDTLGFDYWASSTNAMKIHHQYCMDRAPQVQTYAQGFWGLNASDGPDGYAAYGAIDGPENGTVSPTGAISSIIFVPTLALSIARLLYEKLEDHLWGKYGFSNALNIDRDWYDHDVIGIDLGMALLAIENHRTGLVWNLMHSFYSTAPALRAAGFHLTLEPEPRPVHRPTANAIIT